MLEINLLHKAHFLLQECRALRERHDMCKA